MYYEIVGIKNYPENMEQFEGSGVELTGEEQAVLISPDINEPIGIIEFYDENDKMWLEHLEIIDDYALEGRGNQVVNNLMDMAHDRPLECRPKTDMAIEFIVKCGGVSTGHDGIYRLTK